MEQRFQEEWTKLTGASSAGSFVLAISGGIDSVVLCRLLLSVGADFSLAHCNFKLRGIESDKDEEFVRRLAREIGVPLHCKSFSTGDYALEKGISVQMAARELRYSWFDELVKGDEARLVTAHHANDVTETMLFNLTKGTGLAGLHGIRARDHKIIRPLHWATKEEIQKYANDQQLSWREDQSNTDTKYARNRIRRQVIPELEKINPSLVKAVGRTASRIADAEKLIDYLIAQQAMTRSDGKHFFINKEKLTGLPGKATVLYRLLSHYGYNYDQVEAILESLDSVGATFSTPQAIMNIDRQDLIVSAPAEQPKVVLVEADDHGFSYNGEQFTCRKVARKEYAIVADPGIGALDYESLQFPLQVRPYRQGERFQPFGMQGKKLLSDFLIDEKVPVNLKMSQGVVESSGEIAWVIARRIDDRFRISEQTRVVFEITRQQSQE